MKKRVISFVLIVALLCTVVPLSVAAEESLPPLTLWQLGQTTKQLYDLGNDTSMGYVLLTETGEIVIIDGGNAEEGAVLWDLLIEIGGERPHVSAWFLTHAHSDHYMAFTDVMQHHADAFDLDAVYYRFPTLEELKLYDGGAAVREGAKYYSFLEIEPQIGEIRHDLTAGDLLTFGTMTLEVLFVPGDRYQATKDLNSTSAVLRVEAAGQSILFLGDLTIGEDLLREVPAEKLRADVCQMAHHGQGAVQKAVYRAAAPSACLWPTQEWLWENNERNKGYNTGSWTTIITRRWMDELEVSHHIVSKDGLQKLVFPLDFSDPSWGGAGSAGPNNGFGR